MVKKKINFILIVVIIVSFFIVLYGIYIIYSYEKTIDGINIYAETQIEHFNEIDNVEKIDEAIDEKTEKQVEIVEKEIEKAIGMIIFKSGKKVTIFSNITDRNMKIGVGKLNNHSILNVRGNNILLGHNGGGLSELEHVKVGDIVKIKSNEKTIEYKVSEAYVTTKDDPNPYKSSEEMKVTFITCYPFTYFNETPKRYVVVANSII